MINLYSHLLYVIDLKAYSLTDSLYLQDMVAKKNRSFFDRGKVETEEGGRVQYLGYLGRALGAEYFFYVITCIFFQRRTLNATMLLRPNSAL